MIVWGGLGNINGTLNTGGIQSHYEHLTPTSRLTRLRHATITPRSDGEMIVRGGQSNSESHTTGRPYTPTTNSRTSTHATAPEARYYHTAVWTGSEMIVWGGQGGLTGIQNTGGRYEAATDSWTATSTTNAPQPRLYHTAVWTASTMIVWGGQATAATLTPVDDTTRYRQLDSNKPDLTRLRHATTTQPFGPAVQ
jgi:hypothetical protein